MPFWINLVVSIISFAVAASFGLILIPYLRKLKAGSHILDIGPAWHKSKEGTPLMGGFMFIASTLVATAVGYVLIGSYRSANMVEAPEKTWQGLVLGLVCALGFSAVGFVDDYIKVVKKRNQGFNIKAKSIWQAVVVVVYLVGYYFVSDNNTLVEFPFLGAVDFGWFYYILMAAAIYFVVNSVNFTDGVDGLCGSVTVVYAAVFGIIFILLNNWEYSVLSLALAGGCLGFLVWNLHPAKVFMGDTGSMFLGGLVVALGMESGLELLIPIVGVIYIVEGLSDVIQIASYKIRKKRVFKMAPIHHHFELCGWSEYKIVFVFGGVSILAGVLGIVWAYFYSLA